MSPRELYRLPRTGARSFKARMALGLGLYLAGLLLASGLLGQWVAHRLGYSPHLGEPFLALPGGPRLWFMTLALPAAAAGLAAVAVPHLRRGAPILLLLAYLAGALALGPLYTPVHLYLWAWRFRNVAGAEPYFGGPLQALLFLAGTGAVSLLVWLLREAIAEGLPAETHGSARWAGAGDVRKAGLLGTAGLLLGLWRHRGRLRYLRHDGPEHVLVFAPTRSGKGVGLVVPNLLSWPGSVLVHDIKGENWQLSAGWRAEALYSRCLRFDPTDTTGTAAGYNPLAEIRLGPWEVRDAQNVADILIDPDGGRRRDHWDRTAHALLTGLLLHVRLSEPEPTLARCAQLLAGGAVGSAEETLEDMLTARHDPNLHCGWLAEGKPTRTHPVVAASARGVLEKAPNERSGVISTTLSYLELYRDPVIAANTAESDFRLLDLVHGESPLSLYLTVPPSDLQRTRPLVRMLLNQALRRLTEELPRPGEGRWPLLLMLDEFPALGRLAFFQESLAYLAGYRIRAMLIAQDLAQLYAAYGKDEAITANCHARIAFAPNKPETAELLSRMAGQRTVHLEQRSWRSGLWSRGRPSYSTQQVGRRLLTPDEALRLPAEDELLFLAGQPPIRAQKIRYFEDRALSRRAAVPPPESGAALPAPGSDPSETQDPGET